MPVLITAGLNPEAYRLQRILNLEDVVFADVSQLPIIPGTHSIVLPAPDSSSYVHEMLKACLDLGIGQVFPLHWEEILELSKARTLFSEYNISLMIPSESWIENNERIVVAGRGDKISVLENGKLLAGDELLDPHDLSSETGVFTRATKEQKMEYSLYLV